MLEKEKRKTQKNETQKSENDNGLENLENSDFKNFDYGIGEDYTKYGEFVSTYFAWIPLSKQKEKAEKMEKMTIKDKENVKNFNRGGKLNDI